MQLCLFEDAQVPPLRPLVETRAVYDLRLGLRTLLTTAHDAFDADGLFLHARPLVADVTAQAHDDARVNDLPDGADVLFVNGRFVAAGPSVEAIREHASAGGEARAFVQDDTVVAAWLPNATAHLPNGALDASALSAELFSNLPVTPVEDAVLVGRPWHLLDTLRPALKRDIAARTGTLPTRPLRDRPHADVHASAVSVRTEQIHLGSGATVRPGAILNAEDGPIYIGKNATIYEQAVVRGPCYVGPNTKIKPRADVEGAAFGYWCKVGGEVHDTVIQSLTNKSHPGFLGHAYLGRWCNLGADTNNSNLKNDYGDISVYAPTNDAFVDTGRQFAGLFMGDHVKCGINTMFNTGTVVGTCCNVYGGDFPPRYVPPFSWGGPIDGFSDFHLDKALSVAERVMGRRDTPFTDADRTLLTTLFERTADERTAHHS
jgi:UDP-N-acetylglucosamine diphosphorylase/glucosamine-1-phosphate N-acetyltransferase